MAAPSKNVRLLSRSDQGGRLDGVQVIVHKGHAFIGHMFADGFSVVDVRDALHPKTVAFVAAPKNTRSHHLQIHGDILLAVNGPNIWAMQQYASQIDYYAKPLADSVQSDQPYAAGVRAFDISDPTKPREIGFLDTAGLGAHRIWWVGGQYAYVSVHFGGYIDHILAIVDVFDPKNMKLVGKWWLPGMNRGAGEEKPASFGKRTALHHMITAGNIGYAAWRDGGYTIHDLSDPVKPKLLSHRNHSPPFGGGAHTPLPLPGRKLLVLADEATAADCANGLAYTWVIDVREAVQPGVDRHACRRRTKKTSARRAQSSGRTICTKTARARCRPRIWFSPPITTPACAFTTCASLTSPSKSAISCRRRRRRSSINGPTR